MSEAREDLFATTRWTSVLDAGDGGTTRAQRALEELCQIYWYPLYAYVRSRGYTSHDAEDLTQGFFARLLKLNSLSNISPEKGRFRAFLLASMNHFLAEEWDRASAQKRDVQRTISLDAAAAEGRYLEQQQAHDLTPQRMFERQWALTLLANVVQRLFHEYENSGRGALFRELRFAITGEKSMVPYHDLAQQLGMTDEAVRVAVYRLRQRYREVLREEIMQTVADEADVTAELMELRRILAS